MRETAAALDQRPRPGAAPLADVSEKLAVCISTNPVTTAKLLRVASRLAGRLSREWIAVYVRRKAEDPMRIPSDLQRKFMQNVQLATELQGGSVVVLENEDVNGALVEYCREQDIGLVVLGKTEMGAGGSSTGPTSFVISSATPRASTCTSSTHGYKRLQRGSQEQRGPGSKYQKQGLRLSPGVT